MKTYRTIQGDMWDSIAYKQLGSVMHTDKLINANLKYRYYYTFPAGITLTIPDVDDSTVNALAPWRKAVG